MFSGVKPEHLPMFRQQADERLNDIGGMTIEDRLRILIETYLHMPRLAQEEIDGLREHLPHFEASPPLDAVYGVQTLLRSRFAVAELLMPNLDTYVADLASEEAWEPLSEDDAPPSLDSIVQQSLWGDVANAWQDDIRKSSLRLESIDRDTSCNTNETMLPLEDIDDQSTCFNIARRRLSIMLVDACTGQRSLSQYQASTHPDFPRMQPLFVCGLQSPDGIAALIHGLIADINILPGPGGHPFGEATA